MRPDDEGNPTRRITPTGGDGYELRVEGRIGPTWEAYFDGLAISVGDDGTTVISGPVVDQAALHGLLHALRDIGVPLLSLRRTDPGETPDPTPTDHSTAEPERLDHPEGN